MSAIIHHNVQVQVRDHRIESARPVRVEPVRQTRPVRIDRDDYRHTHPIVGRPDDVVLSSRQIHLDLLAWTHIETGRISRDLP